MQLLHLKILKLQICYIISRYFRLMQNRKQLADFVSHISKMHFEVVQFLMSFEVSCYLKFFKINMFNDGQSLLGVSYNQTIIFDTIF